MPAALKIDFASGARLSAWAGRGLLAAGGLAALAVVYAYQSFDAALVAVEAETRAAARRLGASKVSPPADPSQLRALGLRVTASNRVLSALDQPWFKLFDDVEAAAMPGVALLAFEPDAVNASVRLSGEAQDLDTLARYLERLGARASLRELRLSQHELRDGRERPVLRFSVSARWVRSA